MVSRCSQHELIVNSRKNGVKEEYELEFSRETKTNEDEEILEITFQNDASICNFVDMKEHANSWYEIFRGFGMAAGTAPESARIVSVRNGSGKSGSLLNHNSKNDNTNLNSNMNQKNITPPKFLYRYFSMYKNKKNIFEDNELHFRNPNKFNDPFDCKPLLTLKRDWDQEEYIKFVMHNARDSIGRDLDNEEKQSHKRKAINAFISLDRDQLSMKFNNIIKEGLAKSINEFRILCLSEKYNDILMWSHYADGHRGFVMQFDTEALFENFKQRPQKVFYPPEESYPSIKDFNERNCTHMFLITKSSQWAYEEEWRLLMHIEDKDNPEEEGKVYKFEKGLITGIILGCEMEDPKKEKISEWIREYQPQINIYDAIKDDNFYNINTAPDINEY